MCNNVGWIYYQQKTNFAEIQLVQNKIVKLSCIRGLSLLFSFFFFVSSLQFLRPFLILKIQEPSVNLKSSNFHPLSRFQFTVTFILIVNSSSAPGNPCLSGSHPLPQPVTLHTLHTYFYPFFPLFVNVHLFFKSVFYITSFINYLQILPNKVVNSENKRIYVFLFKARDVGRNHVKYNLDLSLQSLSHVQLFVNA